jgi:hypothetical protein
MNDPSNWRRTFAPGSLEEYRQADRMDWITGVQSEELQGWNIVGSHFSHDV